VNIGLLVAAAGVGFGHAVMPDHWMPLAVAGRANRFTSRRVAQLASLAGIAHVVVSIVLGAIIIVVGLQFRSSIESAQDTIVGAILLLTGLGFAALELTGRGHHHGPGGHTHGPGGHDHHHDDGDSHDHDHGHGHGHSHALADDATQRQRLFAILIPFGAAASPDLTILPVFLAAAAVGTATAVGSLIVFALVTIGTIVVLTVAAFLTGYKLTGHWLDRWGNLITAGVLLIIGLLVITHTI
jgi:ABC-type nickel/cobalt efflux system permease component RcnA